MVFDMGFTKRIVSKSRILTARDKGPDEVKRMLDVADSIISEDGFTSIVVDQYHEDPSKINETIRKLLISD